MIKPNIVKALIEMARCNIPSDIQELLVHGNPKINVPPGVLEKVLVAANEKIMLEEF